MSSLPLLKKRLQTNISYVITILSPNFILLVTFLKESLSSYNRFMSQNSYLDLLQSAFRKGHSTDTGFDNIYAKVSPSLYCQMVLIDPNLCI